MQHRIVSVSIPLIQDKRHGNSVENWICLIYFEQRSSNQGLRYGATFIRKANTPNHIRSRWNGSSCPIHT